MNEPIFLQVDEVYRIHDRSLKEHGGGEGVINPGLVESAVASAQNTFHYAKGDVFYVAASYAYHIAEAQAFRDGNKRAAVASAMVFLAINGVYARPSREKLHQAMLDVANKKMSKADLAEIFRRSAEQ